MNCTVCGRLADALFRCGYDGPLAPGQPSVRLGCRKLICVGCVDGLLDLGKTCRPLCPSCKTLENRQN